MALKFLNKKGWHTGSLRNIETVWKAEQKHEAEQRKLEELKKQILEEREKQEFRSLQEQAGLVPKQERLEFLYDSGLSVGKTSSSTEDYLLGKPVEEVKTENVVTKVAATPGALFVEDNTPQSANDQWRKLHSDPLLLIRKQEQANLAHIKNNPVKMEMIKKSIEPKLSKKDKKRKLKDKKRKEKKRKKNLSDSDEELKSGTGFKANKSARREQDEDYSFSEDEPETRRRPSKEDDTRVNSQQMNGSPKRRISPRLDRHGSPGKRHSHGDRRYGSPRRQHDSPRQQHESSRMHYESPRRQHESPKRRDSPARRHGRSESPASCQQRESLRRRHESPRRWHDSYRRQHSSPDSHRRHHSPDSRYGNPRLHNENPRTRYRSPRRQHESPGRHDSPTRRNGSPENPASFQQNENSRQWCDSYKRLNSPDSRATRERDGTSRRHCHSPVRRHDSPRKRHDSPHSIGSHEGEETKLKARVEKPKDSYPEKKHEALVVDTSKPESSGKGSNQEWNKPKGKHQAGKLSEEEKAARLREMQMDAEAHEEQRWQRVKKASDADKLEEARKHISNGKNFLDVTARDVYGTGGAGNTSVEESVRRRTHFIARSIGDSNVNTFQRP